MCESIHRINIKYSSRNGRIPIINELLCKTSSVRRAGQLLFKNSHIFWASNEVTVAEIFLGVISCKSGIFWVLETLLSMETSNFFKPRPENLCSIIMENLAQNGQAFEFNWEKKQMLLLNHNCVCFLYLRFFRIMWIYTSNEYKNESFFFFFFFVKNIVSKVKTRKQDYHFNEWH